MLLRVLCEGSEYEGTLVERNVNKEKDKNQNNKSIMINDKSCLTNNLYNIQLNMKYWPVYVDAVLSE